MAESLTIESSDDEPEILDEYNYVNDAKDVIYSHDEINLENALVLNKLLQKQLLELKTKLLLMLKDCQKKYKRNEKLLSKLQREANTQNVFTQLTYYFCGAPYFKTSDAFSAPPTADYVQRKRNRELFPMDLMKTRGTWLPRDKINLIQGVKTQLLKYLYALNKRKLREIKFSGESASKEQLKLWEDTATLDDQPLVTLMNRLDDEDDFTVDWYTISTAHLDGRHTTSECIGMWYGYLMPSLSRKPWSSEEEDRLLGIANMYSLQNWDEIASQMEGRSAYQCFIYFQTALADRNLIKNMRWTKEEDDLLVQLVEKFRVGNIIPWTKISDKMPGRYKAQLYNRYMYSINPQIDHSRFTIEEDCILMAAIKEYGTNFQLFPQNLLPGRSLVQIRNRYNNVLKFVKQRDNWTIEHDKKLIELTEKYGTSNWAAIAQELKTHPRVSCRSRYNTIVKFIQKNPNCTIDDVPRRKRELSTDVTTNNWMETIIKQKREDCESLIDEIEEETEEARERRLNSVLTSEIGIQYYDYFKYSFNFKIGKQHTWTSNIDNYKLLKSMCQMLKADKIDLYDNLMNPLFSDFTNVEKKEKIILVTNFERPRKENILFPPNLRNVLAVRGLLTMFECKETIDQPHSQQQNTTNQSLSPVKRKKLEKEIKEVSDVSVPTQAHLDLFKQRFFALFRNAALLAEIPLPNAKTELQTTLRTRIVPKPRKQRSKKPQIKQETTENITEKITTATTTTTTTTATTAATATATATTTHRRRKTMDTNSPISENSINSNAIAVGDVHNEQIPYVIEHMSVPAVGSIVEIPAEQNEFDYCDTINEVNMEHRQDHSEFSYTLETESGVFEIRLYDEEDELEHIDNEQTNFDEIVVKITDAATTSQQFKQQTVSKKRRKTIDRSTSSSGGKRLKK